jgi:hypothetical protein
MLHTCVPALSCPYLHTEVEAASRALEDGTHELSIIEGLTDCGEIQNLCRPPRGQQLSLHRHGVHPVGPHHRAGEGRHGQSDYARHTGIRQ